MHIAISDVTATIVIMMTMTTILKAVMSSNNDNKSNDKDIDGSYVL